MTENNNIVFIDKKYFFVEEYEFTQIKKETFSNLKMLKGIGEYERITGLTFDKDDCESLEKRIDNNVCSFLNQYIH